MSVADYEKQKKRVRKYFSKWRTCLGLAWWTIDLAWEYDSSNFSDEDGYQGIAFVKSRWEYKTATIHFNMHLLAERTDEQLEGDVLHELVHIPLFEMEPKQKDFLKHRERVICSLTSAFQWVRDEGFEEGRRAMRREMRSDR